MLLFLPLWKEVTCIGMLCLHSQRFSRHHWLKHGATWSDLRAGLAFSRLDQILPEASKILWLYEKQLSISKRNALIRFLKPLAGTWQLLWSHIKDLQHINFIHCCFVTEWHKRGAVICFPVTNRQMLLSWLLQVLELAETCRTCKYLVPW